MPERGNVSSRPIVLDVQMPVNPLFSKDMCNPEVLIAAGQKRDKKCRFEDDEDLYNTENQRGLFSEI